MNEVQWSGKELKERSKMVLRWHYWRIVLVSVIAAILIGCDGLPGNAFDNLIQEGEGICLPGLENGLDNLFNMGVGMWNIEKDMFLTVSAVSVLFLFGAASAGGILLIVFVGNPMQVGTIRFYNRSFDAKPQYKELFHSFEHRYKNVVAAMFLKDIMILLWMLVFVIPGIVKAYEYKMVPYLLSEHPDMQPGEVLSASRQLMRGQKGKAFLLDLSFLGWRILSGITFGLAGVLFVTPYIGLTGVALYRKLLGGDEILHNIYYEGMEEEQDTDWRY